MQGKISNRERIKRCFLGQDIDRTPWFLFFGPWPETAESWKKEIGSDIDYTVFEYDEGIVSVNQWVNMGFCPAFPHRIIEKNQDHIIYQDNLGIIQESIEGKSGIPHIIRNPVKNREDWLRIKSERLDPDNPDRFPDNWKEIVVKLNEGDTAIQLGNFPYGLFGTLRDLMGVENLLIAFYDDPELVFEIMSDLTDLWLDIYKKVCIDIDNVELVHMWEDMSGKQGSLISPAMVREFMIPNYQRITDFRIEYNIPGFFVDTDGRCEELIEPFMSAGVNAMLPFEVAAGNDVIDIHRRFPELVILGGIDKRNLYAGSEALVVELERIRPLLSTSQYIPALDHLVPPEVSWNDFCEYSRLLREMII